MEKENEEKKITVRPLNRFNWEAATQLELHEYQSDFMPPILHSIAQSKFEDLEPMGIFAGDDLVGFAMYGNFSGICWINRIMLDKTHQEKGYGKKALQLILDKIKTRPNCQEIRTSFVRANALAEYFFGSMGFQRIADGLDGEIVMRWRPS